MFWKNDSQAIFAGWTRHVLVYNYDVTESWFLFTRPFERRSLNVSLHVVWNILVRERSLMMFWSTFIMFKSLTTHSTRSRSRLCKLDERWVIRCRRHSCKHWRSFATQRRMPPKPFLGDVTGGCGYLRQICSVLVRVKRRVLPGMSTFRIWNMKIDRTTPLRWAE